VLEISDSTKIATINMEDGCNYSINILDDNGTLLQSIKIGTNELQLNLSKLSPGHYSVKVETLHETILKSIQIK
jgi:hypothetical protein